MIIIWLVNMIVYGIFRPENRETKRELIEGDGRAS